jgi:hypothetical protein
MIWQRRFYPATVSNAFVVNAHAHLSIRIPKNRVSSVISSFLNAAAGMISPPKVIFIQRPPRIVLHHSLPTVLRGRLLFWLIVDGDRAQQGRNELVWNSLWSQQIALRALIHANVSSGASCHARVEESYRDLDVQRLPVYVSPGVPPWVHVFSKSTTSSSFQTQLAAIAHLTLSISHKARHNCRLCAKKKFKKQQQLLWEVIVPTDLSINLLSGKRWQQSSYSWSIHLN